MSLKPTRADTVKLLSGPRVDVTPSKVVFLWLTAKSLFVPLALGKGDCYSGYAELLAGLQPHYFIFTLSAMPYSTFSYIKL